MSTDIQLPRNPCIVQQCRFLEGVPYDCCNLCDQDCLDDQARRWRRDGWLERVALAVFVLAVVGMLVGVML